VFVLREGIDAPQNFFYGWPVIGENEKINKKKNKKKLIRN